MTKAKVKIKKGDQVFAIAGRDKGKKGEVLKVLPEDNRAVVSGINIVKKHQKATQAGPGGIVQKELPIHISNLAIVDPKSGEASKVGYKTLDNGDKVRVARKSGEVIN